MVAGEGYGEGCDDSDHVKARLVGLLLLVPGKTRRIMVLETRLSSVIPPRKPNLVDHIVLS